MITIRLLQVPRELQPESQWLDWPPDCLQYGVEQDFLKFLEQGDALVDTGADWYYFPMFWNRHYLNQPIDRRMDIERLQVLLDATVFRPERTFTVCEYDPLFLQPALDLRGMTVFTANRAGEYPRGVFDIPLLLYPHSLTVRTMESRRVIFASFIGHLGTHIIRKEMELALKEMDDCFVTSEPHRIDKFLLVMRDSYIALAPRGDGAQSFRFYEAMQAGVVPLYISDIDARTSKKGSMANTGTRCPSREPNARAIVPKPVAHPTSAIGPVAFLAKSYRTSAFCIPGLFG